MLFSCLCELSLFPGVKAIALRPKSQGRGAVVLLNRWKCEVLGHAASGYLFLRMLLSAAPPLFRNASRGGCTSLRIPLGIAPWMRFLWCTGSWVIKDQWTTAFPPVCACSIQSQYITRSRYKGTDKHISQKRGKCRRRHTWLNACCYQINNEFVFI